MWQRQVTTDVDLMTVDENGDGSERKQGLSIENLMELKVYGLDR